MKEEPQVALAILILEQEVNELTIKRNKSFSDKEYQHYNDKIMGLVSAVITLRSWISPEIDE